MSVRLSLMTALVTLSGLAGGVVDADWVDEGQVGAFRIRSEFPLRGFDDISTELTQLQDDLEETLGLECNDHPIHVYLFASRSSYRAYLSIRIPDGVQRKALYVPAKDAGRIYVVRGSDMATDLRHEATHALLRNALPYVPLWLDEGLAEYFEAPSGRRFSGHPHERELKWAIRFGWRPDFDRLERHKGLLDMTGKDYRDAWGIVHFCLHSSPQAKNVLLAYLQKISDAELPGSLDDDLRRVIPDVERRITQHLK